MKELGSLGELITVMTAATIAIEHQKRHGLEKALQIIERDAKRQIGHYQRAVGDFPAWAPLADSTEAQKKSMGAPTNAPLLRHGELYASFQHEVLSSDEGVVGSTDPVMIYHEFGTSKMPPRPVLGPAVVKNRERITRALTGALVAGILGGKAVEDAGDYFGGELIKP